MYPCDSILIEDQKEVNENIADFLRSPDRKQLETTNASLSDKIDQNLIELSIQKDYFEATNTILDDIDPHQTINPPGEI